MIFGFGYHIDPATISFFSNTIEVYDATMTFVDENLDDVGSSTLPNRHCYPRTSELIREVPAHELSEQFDVPLSPESYNEKAGLRTRFDPTDLNPVFASALDKLIQTCLDRGAKMVPYTGLRTPWEQTKLRRQSRSTAVVKARISQGVCSITQNN